MGRFSQPPDPDFVRINSSIAFDRRLAPYEVRQSRAHARALRAIGVLDDKELEAIDEGLSTIAAELERGGFPFQPEDEDIHMAIERRLTQVAGEVGGKLHTGRSRNDQVATDMAMFVGDAAQRDGGLVVSLMKALLELARSHADWPLPGYSHLQRAQPVYLGHHLLAYFWMLGRDASRLAGARDAAAELPLGSGAMAGVNWDIDRQAVARELGFTTVSPNSMDAVSNRDFVLDYLGAASTCALHLSRLGAEIVLWSSEEFGFCELADSFASGSSIMPQKKNPDAAELLRAKAHRVASSWSRLVGVMSGLPLAYSKDMQEDKEPLFDAIDTVEGCLDVAEGMLAGISFDRGRMARAAASDLMAATDLADLLVGRGVPFRQAHEAVGDLVRRALEKGVSLAELEPEEMDEHAGGLGDEGAALLRKGGWLESKISAGGTSSARLAEQLVAAERRLAELDS
jgi:argininosuccinate lyase